MNREEKSQLSINRIIAASTEEFGTHGYSSSSVNNICRNGNISKGMLFHHFHSKEELFCQCVSRCIDELCNYIIERCVNLDYQNPENITEHFMLRVEFFEAHPHYRQIFFTAMYDQPKGMEEKIQQMTNKLSETNQTILLKLLKQYKLKDQIDPDEVAASILDFSNYLNVKYKAKIHESSSEIAEIIEKQQREFANLIAMVLYGIVQ